MSESVFDNITCVRNELKKIYDKIDDMNEIDFVIYTKIAKYYNNELNILEIYANKLYKESDIFLDLIKKMINIEIKTN